MKWLFRLLITLCLVVTILLLVALPHILGNQVITEVQVEVISDVLYSITKLPCLEVSHGRFC
jgi:hypothetical protein